MERRYLVAALAIIATFAVFSRGFRSLEQLSLRRAEHSGAMAKARCGASSAARALAKIRTHLRPGYPEEAQLLAEMNVPFADLETRAQDMARQNIAASQCARAAAMREAERARRDAMRMRQHMARAAANVRIDPFALEVNLPPDLDRRLEEQNAAFAARISATNAKLQMAAVKLQEAHMRLANPQLSVIEVDDPEVSPKVVTHIQCQVQTLVRQHVQQAVRDAVRQMEYGYTTK